MKFTYNEVADMAVNPKQLVETLKNQCEEVSERVPDYRAALLDTVADIVYQEREHTIAAIPIQQRVTDQCDALGKFLAAREQRS